ncbi:MAG: T9SS type A sorting domain-containing protein [Bacteroidetes bacterium]|nr:T9SS type A sorting domain-containing protein [Bacteroidota bacterium]
MDFLKTTFYDSCANAMIPMDAAWSQSFANGLGEIESTYSSVGGYAWLRLYCFEKGSESWGTCRDLSTIIGLESPGTSLFSIAPNPASDVITLRLSAVAKTPLQVRILNSLGEFEAETTLVAGSQSQQVEVSKLPAGLHHLQIEGLGRTMAVRRIVVVR